MGLYEGSGEEIKLQAQRFVRPLYVSDGLGGYAFSSTMTFVTLRGAPFVVFAAHALSGQGDGIDELFNISTEGAFVPLSKYVVSYDLSKEHDLVLCRTSDFFDQVNYFNLNYDVPSSLSRESFNWIGFPKKKVFGGFHKSKTSKEHILSHLIDAVGGGKKWTSNQYLIVGVTFLSEEKGTLRGEFNNKNVVYDNEGHKEQGYSLRGMSGGALFRILSNSNSSNQYIDELFIFSGIGLEYIDNKIVGGASRCVVRRMAEDIIDKF